VLALGSELRAAIVNSVEEGDLLLGLDHFRDQGHGSFMGFHDWLRTPSFPKQVVGVRFLPHEKTFLPDDLLRGRPYLRCSAGSNGIEVFFQDARDFDQRLSGDQSFSFNKVMIANTQDVALVLDTEDLSPDELADIHEKLNLTGASWQGLAR
jgi:hypothetical protein